MFGVQSRDIGSFGSSGIPTVNIAPNRAVNEIEDGRVLPALVQTERNSTVNVLIDSQFAYTGDESEFRVKLPWRLQRCRFIKLRSVIIPQLWNINNINNTVSYYHDNLLYTVTLPPGYYSPSELASQLSFLMSEPLLLLAIPDTINIEFNGLKKNFSGYSNNSTPWYFLDTCPFIKNGKSCANFYGYAAPGPQPPVFTHESGVSAMIYCRYLQISSTALCQYAFASSILSDVRSNDNIIGIVDLTSLTTDYGFFDSSKENCSIYRKVNVFGAPTICLLNSQRNMNDDLDFQITDPYGNYLNSIGPIGISIAMIFEVTF
jgi:hypothetical protein